MKLEGIHHITAITGDAPANVEFYVGVLGLRLVKKTVNQDDPTVYHLFYADEHGSPGADLTFFEYPGARPGRAGAGMVHRVVWRVASPESLDFWERRLGANGVATERTGDGGLLFSDPEGLDHELVVSTAPDAPLIADAPDIPREHALQGFDGVRAYAGDPERSAALLRDTLGFTGGEDGAWEVRGDERGGRYVYDEPPSAGPVSGGGTIHHVAFATHDRGARGVAGPCVACRRARDARDRPLLLPLGLLPRAQRRAVRARHDRSRLRRRRGRVPPGRAAFAAAQVRGVPRAARAHAHAAPDPRAARTSA